jgi:hypothetical protein
MWQWEAGKLRHSDKVLLACLSILPMKTEENEGFGKASLTSHVLTPSLFFVSSPCMYVCYVWGDEVCVFGMWIHENTSMSYPFPRGADKKGGEIRGSGVGRLFVRLKGLLEANKK